MSKLLKTVIDERVSWCLHCGKPRVALLRRYHEYGHWVGERQAEASKMEQQDDEQVEHVWCSGCGLLYHPDSI